MLEELALPMGATDVILSEHTNAFSRHMVTWARNFDRLSENVIDMNMCTGHCPCYVAPMDIANDTTHLAIGRFHSVSEPYLNLRGRTWNTTTQGNSSFVPFQWTENPLEGVTNFEQCLNNHFKDGMTVE